jgi:thiosulfate/3-mercaptopyruvate sulfurtransferase
MLIGCESLHQHLGDPEWVVFDCRHDVGDHRRGAQAFLERHIPGSFFAAVETDLTGPAGRHGGRHPLPDPDTFAGFLASKGVTPRSWIIAYDDGSGQYAARLWWLARWIGHNHVGVLDGGYPRWVATGYPTTNLPSIKLPPGHLRPHVNWGMAVTVEELQRERWANRCLVLDPVAGRIPGARNRFFKDNLTLDLTMRPRAELRQEFLEIMGDRPPPTVIHQCGSGISACVNLLAMEHAGLRGSRLFPGSWSEWIRDPRRPVARGVHD